LIRIPAGRTKKCGSDNPDPHQWRRTKTFCYFAVGPLDVGGQGWPLGAALEVVEFPWLFSAVEGDEPGLEDPLFGVEAPADPAVLGKDPHGEPLGVVPGVVEEFGFTVEG
jgi:hypothetical protein